MATIQPPPPLFVAVGHRGTPEALSAYNYDWPIVFASSFATSGGKISSLVLEIPDRYHADYQADRYASGLIPAQVFEGKAAAIAWLKEANLAPRSLLSDGGQRPTAQSLDELVEVVETAVGQVENSGWSPCECDPGVSTSPCAWCSLLDELDRVQGKQPRRAGI